MQGLAGQDLPGSRCAAHRQAGGVPQYSQAWELAESELCVLPRACLGGKHADEDSLENALNACVSDRKTLAAIFGWRVSARNAGTEPRRLYCCYS